MSLGANLKIHPTNTLSMYVCHSMCSTTVHASSMHSSPLHTANYIIILFLLLYNSTAQLRENLQGAEELHRLTNPLSCIMPKWFKCLEQQNTNWALRVSNERH